MDKKIRVFISYGSPEGGICKQIYNYLKNKMNYDVWYDKESINFDDDWREVIYEGVKSSDVVLACLSEYSTRKHSVCLDELRIAISVKGGNIKSILLDDAKKIHLPASVTHRQWLDMSNWKEIKNSGNEKFKRWFNGKMKELVSVIEKDNMSDFCGDISFLRENLRINYDASRLNMYLERKFVGREWLEEEIFKWFEMDNSNICLLFGEPGSGKSAFLAKLIHFNPNIVGGVFCDKYRKKYNSVEVIIQTIAYLLACKLSEYRTILVEIIRNLKNNNRELNFLEEYNSYEIFEKLISEPLKGAYIDGNHENLILCIDAIDEAEIDIGEDKGNLMADVLSHMFVSDNAENISNRLPRWLKVLITSRKNEYIRNKFSNATVIELDDYKQENNLDIYDYFASSFEGKKEYENYREYIDELCIKSENNFLYANLVIKSLIMGYSSLDEENAFPYGLEAFIFKWFQWMFPDTKIYNEKFSYACAIIAGVSSPINIEDLKIVCEWSDYEMNQFIRVLESHISIYEERDRNLVYRNIVFNHSFVNKWIVSDKAGKYKVNVNESLQIMLKRIFDYFHSQTDKKMSEYLFFKMHELIDKFELEDLFEKLASNENVDALLVKNIHKYWCYFDYDRYILYKNIYHKYGEYYLNNPGTNDGGAYDYARNEATEAWKYDNFEYAINILNRAMNLYKNHKKIEDVDISLRYVQCSVVYGVILCDHAVLKQYDMDYRNEYVDWIEISNDYDESFKTDENYYRRSVDCPKGKKVLEDSLHIIKKLEKNSLNIGQKWNMAIILSYMLDYFGGQRREGIAKYVIDILENLVENDKFMPACYSLEKIYEKEMIIYYQRGNYRRAKENGRLAIKYGEKWYFYKEKNYIDTYEFKKPDNTTMILLYEYDGQIWSEFSLSLVYFYFAETCVAFYNNQYFNEDSLQVDQIAEYYKKAIRVWNDFIDHSASAYYIENIERYCYCYVDFLLENCMENEAKSFLYNSNIRNSKKEG